MKTTIKQRKKMQEYYKLNKEKIKEQKMEYRNRKKNRKIINMRRKKYYKNNKIQVLSQDKAYRKISLDLNCLFCNTTKNLQRHHPNYNEPLRINTLCSQCHYNIHHHIKVIGENENE